MQPLPLDAGLEKSDLAVAGDEDLVAELAAVPVATPGLDQYLKWWKLVTVLLGV
ncbi:hypothetical protein [Mycobacterium lepromatosis]|uniref:hypothetical protein n=1 Tax=Mycobacterium lepromatosis TaxID=480418 RepID=UPI0012E01BD1|nr:hypothetical protein [Mycobacterium lepromatosis]